MDTDDAVRLTTHYINQWSAPLELDTWKNTLYIDTDEPERSVGASGADSPPIMSIVSDWQYRTNQITLYTTSVEMADEASFEEYVVHELCHALVCKLRDTKPSTQVGIEEEVVTILARSFLRTRDKILRETSAKVEELIKAADAALEGKPARYTRLKKKLARAL